MAVPRHPVKEGVERSDANPSLVCYKKRTCLSRIRCTLQNIPADLTRNKGAIGSIRCPQRASLTTQSDGAKKIIGSDIGSLRIRVSKRLLRIRARSDDDPKNFHLGMPFALSHALPPLGSAVQRRWHCLLHRVHVSTPPATLEPCVQAQQYGCALPIACFAV